MNKIFENIKCFLFDLDGTVYIGDKLIDGAKRVFQKIKSQNKSYKFLTNNSSKSADEYFDKLKGLNIELEKSDIITSNMVTINYLKWNFSGKRVYLFASDGVKNEYKTCGINLTQDYKNCDVSLLTYNTALDYKQLCEFVLSLKKSEFYFATHTDINCPSEEGDLPDAGSIIELINASANMRPQKIFGKPYKIMGEFINGYCGLQAGQIAMVGDRLYTDMEFAKNCSYKSILVLSGETKKDMVTKKYDLVIDSIKNLLQLLD